MVKIAPATSASPTLPAVRAMFCSRMPPRKAGRRNRPSRSRAGIVAATVCPAFMRDSVSGAEDEREKEPSATAFNVISGCDLGCGISADGSKSAVWRGGACDARSVRLARTVWMP